MGLLIDYEPGNKDRVMYRFSGAEADDVKVRRADNGDLIITCSKKTDELLREW